MYCECKLVDFDPTTIFKDLGSLKVEKEVEGEGYWIPYLRCGECELYLVTTIGYWLYQKNKLPQLAEKYEEQIAKLSELNKELKRKSTEFSINCASCGKFGNQ